MPQVDLESLVSVCGGGTSDRKISCETLAAGDPPAEDAPDLPENAPDLPPDSFWLSKDAELDWFDRNAFYERKDSTKANSHSTTNLEHSNSKSQRFSVALKSKASIIGLPKPQKACFSDAKLRRNPKPPNARLFPKKPAPEGKSVVPAAEPSSPKVSCMGRVRSKKDRSRRCRNRQRGLEQANRKEKTGKKRRNGLWNSLTGIFRSGGKQKPASQPPLPPSSDDLPKDSPKRSSASIESPASGKSVEPPGLGGVKRFASGRRSDSWGIVGVDSESNEAAQDHDDGVWGRRGMGPLKGVDCGRGREPVGPASV